MKNKFTSIQLNIQFEPLAVLNVRNATQLHVDCGEVWLTHTQSNQDYVLKAGAHLTVSAGKILMSSAQSNRAWVTVNEPVLSSVLSTWMHAVKRKVQDAPAICICDLTV